jgi:hypothetical protein
MERVKTESSTSGRISPASEVALESSDTHTLENSDERYLEQYLQRLALDLFS